ncbi:MAG TPA: universal stress protein, partial [Polyangia bacterium]
SAAARAPAAIGTQRAPWGSGDGREVLMTPIKRILAPVDFSPSGARALDEAMGLARTVGASVTLLHVYTLPQPIPDAGVAYGPEVLDALELAARDRLDQLRDELRRAGGDVPEIDTRTALGVAHDEIIAEARRGGYDLVVMGTHGRTGWRRLVLGSVAERVVRSSPVAVLTVHPSEEAAAHPSAAP